MPVDTLHVEYEDNLAKWERVRDCLGGEDSIKAAGQRYVPKLDSQSETEYEAYVMRGMFYNATARTLSGYEGMIFRMDPAVHVPLKGALADVFSEFISDVDMMGTTIASYSRRVVNDVAAVGRAGTLIDWREAPEDRAFVAFYPAESILNWRQQRINGRMTLTLLTLREKAVRADSQDEFVEEVIDQIRVLRLVQTGENVWQYQVEIWQLLPDPDGSQDAKKKWQQTEISVPMRKGQSLSQIPFVFHGPTSALSTVERSPMEDIVVANVDHFRVNVDFKHGLHFTALPTAWVSGFPASTELKVGSRTAWVTETLGATAGFLEFKGQGLETFERALDRIERLLTVLGSRLLESQKRVSESAEALSIRQAGESSILGNLSKAVSASLTDVLRWVYWWHSTASVAHPSDVTEQQAVLKLNTDFETAHLTGKEIEQLVAAWLGRAISHDTLLYNFKQGEMLPPGRTIEEEMKLIVNKPPPPPPAPAPVSGSGKPAPMPAAGVAAA